MPEEKEEMDPDETLRVTVTEIVLEDIRIRGQIFRAIIKQLISELARTGKKFQDRFGSRPGQSL
jgi:hypothetical protein